MSPTLNWAECHFHGDLVDNPNPPPYFKDTRRKLSGGEGDALRVAMIDAGVSHSQAGAVIGHPTGNIPHFLKGKMYLAPTEIDKWKRFVGKAAA